MKLIQNHKRLLNAGEVAEMLGTKQSTIKKWVFERKIPFVKFGPGKKSLVKFDPERINKWIEEQSHEPQSDYELYGKFMPKL